MNRYRQESRPERTERRPTGTRFPTESHLDPDVRASIDRRLDRTLADATVLATHAKFAHWNVRGMSFYALHQLFDEIADALEEHVDLVAERITALGGQARGTAGMAVSTCHIPGMPTDLTTGPQYVEALVERLAIHDANLAEDIQAATDLGDLDTADLLNEVSREVSKYRWFLEAHVRTQPVGSVGERPAAPAPPTPQPVQPAASPTATEGGPPTGGR